MGRDTPQRWMRGGLFPAVIIAGGIGGAAVVYQIAVGGGSPACSGGYWVSFVGRCIDPWCAGIFGGMLVLNLLLYFLCLHICSSGSSRLTSGPGPCSRNCALIYFILAAILIVMLVLFCTKSPGTP